MNLPVRVFLFALLAGAACLPGCGTDDPGKPPGPPTLFPDLFYEPPAFCLSGLDDTDSLAVYNFGDTLMVWTPVHVPPGSEGLDAPAEIPPGTGVLFLWSWSPSVALPAADSIVAETDDPDRPRVVIRVEVQEPGNPDRVTPLPAPFLLSPEDGAVFRYRSAFTNGIPLEWSRIDDCSKVVYELEVSRDPSFRNLLCCPDTLLTDPYTALYVEKPSEAGTVYWRVIADKTNPSGAMSIRGLTGEYRSWTVLPPENGVLPAPDSPR